MNECRLCGDETDSESLLCDVCRAGLMASESAASPMTYERQASREARGWHDETTGVTFMRVRDGMGGQKLSADELNRCPTCGRMDHCCCGPDCKYCIGQMPIQRKI